MPTLWSTLVALILVPLCLATPLPVPIEYPLTYNHLSLATPREINDLTAETMQKAQKDVVTTISEVQRLLAADPSLPRLTRGEIADLFETVTKEEYVKSVHAGDMNRAKHMRALMLVLPYNTKNIPSDNLEELYTRPPVTKVVPSEIKPTTMIQKKPAHRPELVAKIDDYVATTYHPKTQKRKTHQPDVYVTTFHPKTAPAFTAEPTVPTKALTVEQKSKYSSHYSAEVANFEEKSKPPMRENVVDLLAAIGLTPDTAPTTTTTTTPTPTTTKKPELTPELEELLKSFGFLQDNEPKDEPQIAQEETRSANYATTAFKPLPESLAKQDYKKILSAPIQPDDFVAFKPIPKDTFKALDDDNRSFFRALGLIAEVEEEVTTVRPTSKMPRMINMPEIDPDLPLPNNMLQALDKVGIVRKGTTAPQKVEETTTNIPPSSSTTESSTTAKATSARSTSVRSTSVRSTSARTTAARSTTEKTTTTVSSSTSKSSTTTTVTPRNHRPVRVSSRARVFSLPEKDMQVPKKITIPTRDPKQKPIEVTQEDLDHLHYLLETIQNLDKLNASIEGSTPSSKSKYNVKSLLGIGPDPVSHVELELAKNEVKRQKEQKRQADDAITTSPEPVRFSLNLTDSSSSIGDSTATLGDSTATIADTAADAQSDAEVKLPDLTSLTDTSSSTTTSTTSTPSLLLAESFPGLDPVTERPLPPPRRTGFYFLADWNSFLEVGDGKEKVEVRFQPQVGDPSRFLPVTVP
ncbi:mucin-2 [Lutzomyia longipalpis]|uniref:mucin-2 n=1 Tax=Lutzomyia longipalpis TaxID=7200 RepID=UPI0024841DE1|nr:mucin-2 [Lutzomyia longipalpis]